MSNSNLQTEALLFLTLRSVPGGIQAGGETLLYGAQEVPCVDVTIA